MDLELEEILGQDNSDKYQSYIYTNFSSYEALLKTFTLVKLRDGGSGGGRSSP